MGRCLERIALDSHCSLDDYASFASLAEKVRELRAEASSLVPRLRGRAVWMLSSTATGGGVAEMMPRVIALLRELGVAVEWVVLRTDRAGFFRLTKRIHNLVHGEGDPRLEAADREFYEAVSRECANDLVAQLAAGDLLVVHDPQPLGAGMLVKRALGVPLLWRCHIGLDDDNAATRAAWDFLRPFADACDHALFSASEYIRDFLAGRSSVMHPTIDPLDHKNRDLAPTKLVGILCNSGLVEPVHPVLTPPFATRAVRLQPDGSFAPISHGSEVGLLYRPVVTQISRWDRLKGFAELLDGFCALKQRLRNARSFAPRQRRRLEIVRLVLAGPEPGAIADDPESVAVLAELVARYRALPAALQEEIAIVALPMASRKHNALMVNCLQRCSAIVVQSSLREAFGLTATEAMWKSIPVMGTHACGLRQQVRDRLDGRLVRDPTDVDEIAATLEGMLAQPKERLRWGRSGQKRVYDEFLVFAQVRQWLRELVTLTS